MLVVIISLLISCDNITENEAKSNSEITSLKKEIKPLALSYLVKYTYYWEVENYIPVSNKKLGIWLPHDSYYYSLAKNKYGFSMISVQYGDQLATAINSGYLRSNIMGIIPNNHLDAYHFLDVIFGQLGQYYIDEPIEKVRYSPDELVDFAYYVKQSGNISPILIGGYSTSAIQIYQWVKNRTTNTFFMCDEYEGDQRSYWTSWLNAYGPARVKGNWIIIDDDFGEFYDLLGHANNLGLTQFWMFTPNSGNIDEYLPDFADKAWKTNWLVKKERRYRVEYRCYSRDCSIDDNWEYYETVPLQEFRTLTYNQE